MSEFSINDIIKMSGAIYPNALYIILLNLGIIYI